MAGKRYVGLNYNLDRTDRPKPANKKQAKQYRREDFVETYSWQLIDYGESSHKIITTMPLKEYYHIGLCCIDNDISIAEFIRQSIRKNMGSIPKIAAKINKNNINPNQGTLFD